MRRTAIIAMLMLGAAGCAKAPVHHPAKPVVLWTNGASSPEFPVPPEAAWRPVYQKLRRKLAHRSGSNAQWVCFSAGPLKTVASFYARRYGADQGKLRVSSIPAASLFHTVRKTAASLGHTVPPWHRSSGRVRIIVFPQHQNLPRVRLESPFLNLTTGRVESGTLISMSWRKLRAKK